MTNPTNPVPCTPPPASFVWPALPSSKRENLPDSLAAGMTTPPANAFHMQLTIDASHLSIIIPHVNNLEYVRWLEVLAIAHADALGYDDVYCRAENIIWFVGRHEIDYRAELLENDELLMATWVETIHKYRAQRRYVMVRPRDQRLVATARTTWVLVTRDLHRPLRVPAEMVERFGPTQPVIS